MSLSAVRTLLRSKIAFHQSKYINYKNWQTGLWTTNISSFALNCMDTPINDNLTATSFFVSGVVLFFNEPGKKKYKYLSFYNSYELLNLEKDETKIEDKLKELMKSESYSN